MISDMRRRLLTFGGRVADLRAANKITQKGLVARLGELGVDVGQSYLSTLEGSDRTPTGHVVAALARALSTTTDYLLGLTDDDMPPGMEVAQPEYLSARGIDDYLAADDTDPTAQIDTQRQSMRMIDFTMFFVQAHARLDDDDSAAANAWLRRYVRVWCANREIVSIEWL